MTETEADKRLYKIGEVCRMADVQPYVLRYWETEFPALVPNKSGGGQRLYSRREIDIILRIKQLLYTEGFTIAGAKKKLEVDLHSGAPLPQADAQPVPQKAKPSGRSETNVTKALTSVRKELTDILKMLDES